MHIIQFWRIFWARKLLIIATTAACLVGGILVIKLLPPRYESHARVMLGMLKPDPVTGQTMNGGAMGAYVATQIELVTDFSVTGKVADAVGWTTDPALLNQYQHRSAKDQRDFQHWIAQRVADGTTAKLLDSSNILEITYRAVRPRDAEAVAEVLQKAYIDTNIALHREDAAHQAEWFEKEADKARQQLVAAQDAKAQFERANGVMMQDDKQDMETARLQAMSQQGASTSVALPQLSPSAMELAQTDAVIAEQAKVLGPNHPDLLALKAKRVALAALVAREQQTQRAAAAASARAVNAAIDAQKNSIIAKSDKLERLKQLQSEVNLRRDEFDKAIAAAAQYRQQSAASTGLTVLGPASTPSAPSFPNPLLIVPGSAGLGVVLGVLLSLLIEFLAWRVRGIEDLRRLDVPVLAIIPPVAGRMSAAGQEAVARRAAPPHHGGAVVSA